MTNPTKNRPAFAKVLANLGQRFPEELAPVLRGKGEPVDYSEEAGAINILENILQRCDSELLNTKYGERVAAIFCDENGCNAGVALANANFEQRCRALVEAVAELT